LGVADMFCVLGVVCALGLNFMDKTAGKKLINSQKN
jgi:hypothetical protein